MENERHGRVDDADAGDRRVAAANAPRGRDDAPRPEVRFRLVAKGEWSEHDVERMVDLLQLGFGDWPTVDPGVAPAEYLRWKMSSPGALFSASLGEAGDELVSTETCVGHRVLLRGREGVRIQFADTTVRPEWRGRGVSSASLAFRQRTIVHLYDVSIIDAQSAVMIQRAKKFGTRPLGNRIRPLVLPLERREFARRWALGKRLPPWLGAPAALLMAARSAALRVVPFRPESSGAFRIAAAEHFDDRIDAFFSAAAAPWELVMVRSRAHLEWRYCDRRGGVFHTRVAQDENGVLLGYAIGKARGDQGYLADLLALPGRLDVVSALVDEMDAVLEGAGCVDILCWLPERHPYRATLRRAGYLDARQRPLITYRPCGATPESLEFLAAPETRVHFMLGDTDLV
jgi:GNAT superfamily N-acetyltransferase